MITVDPWWKNRYVLESAVWNGITPSPDDTRLPRLERYRKKDFIKEGFSLPEKHAAKLAFVNSEEEKAINLVQQYYAAADSVTGKEHFTEMRIPPFRRHVQGFFSTGVKPARRF